MQKKKTDKYENRTFQYEVVKEDKEANRVFYKETAEFCKLTRGDYFGGRALLGGEIAKNGFEFESFLKTIPKAKLSVVFYHG